MPFSMPCYSYFSKLDTQNFGRNLGAGSAQKCAFVQADLRFDAAVNHRATDFPAHLAAACPNGIDVYFENVGGAIWQAVLPLLNQGARVPGLWPDRAV